MKGQDHSLSTQNARVEAMQEIIAFVDKYIGEQVVCRSGCGSMPDAVDR
jgi:hypothetical protein